MTPRLSVVIASVSGAESILECLDHLAAQTVRDQMEILVLDRRPDATAQAIAQRFPDVTLRSGLTGWSIPQLRWEGMRAARGEWVAVIEDHCLPPPGWAAEILRFSESPYGVVGGPVENAARDRLLDWAFFLAEYGPCMPPLPEAETEGVPGNNAAYRRNCLPLEAQEWAYVWESFLQNDLRKKGIRIFLNPAMQIYHKKSFPLRHMLTQRFHYSRSFAAMRGRRMAVPQRICWAGLSLALPVILLARIARCVVSKRRNWREFVLGSPVIAMFVTTWAAGELVGYLAGPGDSLARVE